MQNQNPESDNRELLAVTRRHFFNNCKIGLGAVALAALAAEGRGEALATAEPLAPRAGHFPAKAKRVIYLFMAGGPSQLELFDYKPKLQEYHGKAAPESLMKGKRFAFLKPDAKLLGTKRKFANYGKSGAQLSELLPELAKVVDDVCFVRSVTTEAFNHGPAKLFANTGTTRFGLPSMGAWLTYGIGSESRNLPGFVVLQSGPRGPRGGNPLWGSGFLPTSYQGVPFLRGAEPILNLANPAGVSREQQSEYIATLNGLNAQHRQEVGDPEINTRIAQYEMAFRMQTSAPELVDLSKETAETLADYGAEPGKASFANNCLLARRLVERDVRFVQLYHTDWDDHGNPDTNLGEPLERRCRETDKPVAALLRDLKQRGLLEDTLVMWGGEFGRTPLGEPRDMIGRDHHIEGYTMWFAGGGVKPGVSIGQTDELGFGAVEDRAHMHDLHATVLHLLGLDHKKLTFKFQGRNFRLTDVAGNVIPKMLA